MNNIQYPVINSNYSSEYQTWVPRQIVTGSDMMELTQGSYNKDAAISANFAPCILCGCQVSYSSGNILVTEGAVNFGPILQSDYSFLPNDILGIAMVAQPQPITAPSNDAFIVAQFTITPVVANSRKYIINTTIAAVTSVTGQVVELGFYNSTTNTIEYSDARHPDFNNLFANLTYALPASITTNQTIEIGQNLVICNGTSSTISAVTLPLSSNILNTNALSYTVTNLQTDASIINVNASGSDNILGSFAVSITYGSTLTFTYNTQLSTWVII